MDWRPKNLDEFIGNEKLKKRLKVLVNAEKIKQKRLPHCLFTGSYGQGKTTLAYILSSMMDKRIYILNAPSVKDQKKLIECLIKLQDGDILFIDEIHRLDTEIEESLYPAMEDFKIVKERIVLDAQCCSTFVTPRAIEKSFLKPWAEPINSEATIKMGNAMSNQYFLASLQLKLMLDRVAFLQFSICI